MVHSPELRRPLLIAALIYAAGIVYGSLIPFRLRDLTWAEALEGFRAIPFLALGADSRADWIANLLLYMPLAFLLLAALWSRRSRALRVLATHLVLLFCCALAIAVEFVQQFFAPRTVSLNDLLAESLGAAIGVMVWWGFGDRLLVLARDVFRSGPRALRAAFYLYLIALIFLAIFPFDFVVSAAELNRRLEIVAGSLFRLGAFDRSAVHGLASIAGQIGVYAPLGALLVLTRPGATVGSAVRLGAGLALLLEGVQVFLWNGVVTVGGVVFAAVGAAAGVLAVRAIAAVPPPLLRRVLRTAALIAVLPYVAVVVVLNDLVGRPLQPPDRMAAALGEVSFLPFFYHYFTTEVRAVTSMLVRIAMYAPVGAMLWAVRGSLPDSKGAGSAGLLAAMLAAVMEAGRLLVGLTPDPTNVLIAAGAGTGAFALLRLGVRWVSAPRGPRPRRPTQDARPEFAAAAGPVSRPVPTDGERDAVPAYAMAAGEVEDGPPPPPRHGSDAAPDRAASLPVGWRLAPLAVGLAVVSAVLADFPLGAWWLGAGLALYAALLWHRPDWWLAALPAAIGAIDLAPWTGRFFIEEFDLLAVTTLAVLLARRPPARSDLPPLGGSRGMLLALLTLSWLIALDLPAVWAAQADANALNSYFSPYNGLRVGKAFLWALLLLPFLRRALREGPERAFRLLAAGMAMGLAAASLWALAERLAFVGPFDFDTVIRVAGSFSSMHIGGGHLGAFLVMGLPFLAAPLAVRMPGLWRPAALALLAVVGYVLIATFHRASYAAAILAMLIAAAGLIAARRRGRGGTAPLAAGLSLAGLVLAGLFFAAFSGSFITHRFSQAGGDFLIRLDNWQGGMAMRSPGLGPRLFGEGLGSFPVTYLLRNSDGIVPGSFAVLDEGGDRFLRLASGRTQYFEQRVAAGHAGEHALSFEIRSPTGGRFAVLWCRKALQYSFSCRETLFDLADYPDWTTVTASMPPPQRVSGGPLEGWLGARSTLAFVALDRNAVADIDEVALVGPDGRTLIVNGGFEDGTDRWFFADDNHSAWRIFNQYLMLVFEQGWFGLAAFLLAVGFTAVRLMRAIGRGDAASALLLAGLAGFLALGLTESPLEAPRLAFLFYLLLFWGMTRPRRSAAELAAQRPVPRRSRAAQGGALQPNYARSCEAVPGD